MPALTGNDRACPEVAGNGWIWHSPGSRCRLDFLAPLWRFPGALRKKRQRPPPPPGPEVNSLPRSRRSPASMPACCPSSGHTSADSWAGSSHVRIRNAAPSSSPSPDGAMSTSSASATRSAPVVRRRPSGQATSRQTSQALSWMNSKHLQPTIPQPPAYPPHRLPAHAQKNPSVAGGVSKIPSPKKSGPAHEHRLRLAEFQQAVLAAFHADAGLFMPAKRGMGRKMLALIDPDRPGLKL